MDGIFVIAKSWPRRDRGYGIAVSSSLKQYCQVFSDVRYTAITSDPFPEELPGMFPSVTWSQIRVKKEPQWKRFVSSLVVSCPASIVQYASRNVTLDLIHSLSEASFHSGRPLVVFEDIPPAYHLPALKRHCPKVRTVLRSHNVVGEMFEGFEREGGMARRAAWKMELEKLKTFESIILNAVDTVWAISSRDLAEYDRRYGRICDGVLGVWVDARQYRNLPPGDPHTVVYVGSADLRKGHGLMRFIGSVWTSVLEQQSRSRLVLAGRNTQRFQSRALKIDGRGHIECDWEVLSEGMICINPQERGSGIKLKSLIAMLAGKVLISTSKGLEGIDGEHGTHFFRVNTVEEMGPLITYLMEHTGEAIQVGRRAQEHALSLNKEREYAQRVRPLLLNVQGTS